MREYLDSVQFEARSTEELRAVAGFEQRFGRFCVASGRGRLTGEIYGDRFACEIDVSNKDGVLQVATHGLEGIPELVHAEFASLQPEMSFADWVSAFERLASRAVIKIDVTFNKVHEPVAWNLIAFTEEGLGEVSAWAVAALRRGEKPERLVVRTPLLDQVVSSGGLAVVPLSERASAGLSGTLRAPEVENEAVNRTCAQIVGAFAVHALLGISGEREFRNTGTTANEVIAWVEHAPVRAALARSRAQALPRTVDDSALRSLLADLSALETDLARDALTELEAATRMFKEVSVELLRDLHRLRADVTALMTTELFRISGAIAVTVAGLSIASGDLTPTAVATAIGVGALFLLGAGVKAFATEREFRNVLRFHRAFRSMRAVGAVRDLTLWHDKAVRSSVTTFYVSFAMGIFIAAAPVYVLSFIWLWRANAWWHAHPAVFVAFIVFTVAVPLSALRIWSPWTGPR